MKYTDSHVVIPGLTGNLLSIWKVLPLAAVVVLLAACGDDPKVGGTEEDAGIIAIENKTVSGVSQKGPFVNGSSVTIQALNGETLAQTGRSYQGKINDQGEFSVNIESLVSPYVVLKASGFYRNENTGVNSKAPVELFALSDLSNRDEVNVNLLTHLEYERSLYLAADDSVVVSEAKKRAEKEVLTSFEIEGDFKNSEDLNIFGTDDGAAALLAISVLMQGDLSEADFTERLNDYAFDIEKDGKWDDKKTATAIADWASSISLNGKIANIRGNIVKWELSSDIPAFEKYVDNFWWQNYGLGTCNKERQSEEITNSNALSVNNGIHFICDNNAWRMATDLEKDTYKWEDGDDADIKPGDVVKTNCYIFEDGSWRSGNDTDCSLGLRGCTTLRQDTVGKGSDKVWYICDTKNWRNATTYEKDTFGWKDSTDGAIKKGNVTDTIYVFDRTAWRATSNVEAKLGGCVSAIADSIGKVGSTYYICKSNNWVEASAIEYDTYRWAAGKDGDSKPGSVNANNCYVYENSVWRNGDAKDCSLGLRGCTALRQDTVGKGGDKVWYICDSQTWRTATDIEKDTATWGSGDFDGEVRAGQINTTTYYIYEADDNAWRNATTIEKDTYKKQCLTDGSIVDGNVILTNKYVCDDGVFRAATENDLRANLGCTSYTRGEYRILSGQYSYYKCETDGWLFTTERLNQGTMTDERDGHVYKTIGVKTQMWMAENLNYADEQNYPSMVNENWCHNSDVDSCAKYGRLYTWNAAIDYAYWSNQSETCAYGGSCNLPERVQGICPIGWHLPTRNEWNVLFDGVVDVVGKTTKTCSALRSSTGWFGESNGSDVFGFSALPAGHTDNLNYEYAMFWSSTEYHDENCDEGNYAYCGAYFASLRFNNEFRYDAYGKNNIGLSVRCVRDEDIH